MVTLLGNVHNPEDKENQANRVVVIIAKITIRVVTIIPKFNTSKIDHKVIIITDL